MQAGGRHGAAREQPGAAVKQPGSSKGQPGAATKQPGSSQEGFPQVLLSFTGFQAGGQDPTWVIIGSGLWVQGVHILRGTGQAARQFLDLTMHSSARWWFHHTRSHSSCRTRTSEQACESHVLGGRCSLLWRRRAGWNLAPDSYPLKGVLYIKPCLEELVK